MEKRMMLALALSLLVVLVFAQLQKPAEPELDDEVEKKTETVQAADTEPAAAESEPESGTYAEEISDTEVTVAADTVAFATEHLRGHFNLRGAELASVKLPDYPLVENPEESFNLVRDDGGGLRLETSYPQPELGDAEFKLLEDSRDGVYAFRKELDKNLTIRKIYDLKPDQKYQASLKVVVENRSEESMQLNGLDFPGNSAGLGGLALRWGPDFGLDGEGETRFDQNYVYYGKDDSHDYLTPGSSGFLSSIWGNEDKQRKYEFKRGPVEWVGVSNRYFIAAMIPEKPYDKLFMDLADKGEETSFTTWGGFASLHLPAGTSRVRNFNLYLGPKRYDVLQQVKEGLEATLNYGWFTIISLPLLYTLNFIYSLVPNYGIAIILLSLLIKVLLYPLTKKGLTNMQKMRELQPRIEELQDKYEDDKEKLNQKMMELYQEENVNPIGGCLPLILQMPIFISLYRTLQYSIELRGAPFFFWITDLSSRDPYYILPVVMGVVMFAQQSYQASSGGGMGQQKTIAYVMPVVFVFIFMNFPAGLVLYWLTNSAATLGQYWLINRSFEN